MPKKTQKTYFEILLVMSTYTVLAYLSTINTDINCKKYKSRMETLLFGYRIWSFYGLVLSYLKLFLPLIRLYMYYDDDPYWYISHLFGSIRANPTISLQKQNLQSFSGIIGPQRPDKLGNIHFDYLWHATFCISLTIQQKRMW